MPQVPCTAELNLYSGQPNPSWPLSDEVRSQIFQIWEQLDPIPTSPLPTGLGYRGITVICGDRYWTVHEGTVWLEYEGAIHCRRDDNLEFLHKVNESRPSSIPNPPAADSG